MAEEYIKEIKEAAEYIKGVVKGKTYEVGIILGSGLGEIANKIEEPIYIPYKDIPHFPVSTAPSHVGRFVFGKFQGKDVMCMQGRFHYYEGYSIKQVTLPVRVMKLIGVKKLLVTNASGTTNACCAPGDLMLVTDHINLMGTNPLIGPNLAEFGPRFPPMSECYSPRLITLAREIAKEQKIELHEGVYCALSGPTYETKAEVRMVRGLGADACGMSTVPEVIVAAHQGTEVVCLSCLTNYAAGVTKDIPNEDEVVQIANSDKVKSRLHNLVNELIKRM